jgi:hypothetical protein
VHLDGAGLDLGVESAHRVAGEVQSVMAARSPDLRVAQVRLPADIEACSHPTPSQVQPLRPLTRLVPVPGSTSREDPMVALEGGRRHRAGDPAPGFSPGDWSGVRYDCPGGRDRSRLRWFSMAAAGPTAVTQGVMG